ncbi:GGDEF domain-containing protein [Treponema sp.]|uniref:GGDEF domain-containing protein n=1 Tax=Treponema sp. TaxID=166 RepID=UPI00389011A8
MNNSFNYYGYDKGTFSECIELVNSTNRKHIFIITSWFLLVNILYLIFCILNLFAVSHARIPFYASYAAFSLLFDLYIVLLPDFSDKHNSLSVYITITMLLSYGIIASIIQPYMPATIYLVLLIICALSFIDRFYRIIFMLTFCTLVFIVMSFIYKTFSVAYHDTYNGLIVLILALGLHYTFQRTRMHQFILYQRDQHIQRGLEIKSSFDGLTSLLNRTKFFSVVEEILRKKNEENSALCLIDLDGFKEINDTLGHQMGDKTIQVAGKTILDALHIASIDKFTLIDKIIAGNVSFAGRLGGDEFILFIRDKKSRSEIRNFLTNLLSSLNSLKFLNLDGIKASFGVTELSVSDCDIDSAYRRADQALYRSKRAGKNQIFFDDEFGGGI